MWTKHFVVTVAALAGLFASLFVSAGAGFAQSSVDIRQEDRRADRREDRRADRREDRMAEREVEIENEQAENERAENEVKLQIPRTATGAIDTQRLLALVREQLAQGAREIQFRGTTLTAADVQRLLLSTSADQNLLAQIAALLPRDGVERKVTLRGAADVRVTRQPDGTLRARIENVNLGDLTAAQRAELAQQLAAQLGLDRVRIRGVDSAGNRVRVEFRADKGLARNEARVERRGERVAEAGGRDDRRGRADKVERPERAQRPERAERVERADRSGPH